MANGKCRVAEKHAKPDEKISPKTELTVRKREKPSRAAKTSAVFRAGDGKRSDIKIRCLLTFIRFHCEVTLLRRSDPKECTETP